MPRRLPSLADETPEGRSIVVLAKAEVQSCANAKFSELEATFVPFTAQTRMSGVNLRTAAKSAKARPTRSTATSKHRAVSFPAGSRASGR